MTELADAATRSVAETTGGMTPTEREIARISEEVLERQGLAAQDDLFDLGVTSLSFIRILVKIHERYDVALTGAELGDEATIRHLAAQVDAARDGSTDRA
ncbi:MULTISPECIES: acyl carrier protein [Streptomyces]|uniref:Acyl carrier protein n=1 Tax=Streptomyces cyaneofuscatus TaxID=66883 RepID=A0ABZ1F471_9ACTN|nr:acyl carrier protein [Streptomyces cyaneofuscatus]WSB11217.1 acyl carrier protein [Streptomyces cyaneofuscatus]WSD45250.1 acyl carrier protein [Streptomyces cyaneofuscatus]WTA88444.1 acyl carrier protein [Streptomyces cyaneofuscatus]